MCLYVCVDMPPGNNSKHEKSTREAGTAKRAKTAAEISKESMSMWRTEADTSGELNLELRMQVVGRPHAGPSESKATDTTTVESGTPP